jgi:hypothetical protein
VFLLAVRGGLNAMKNTKGGMIASAVTKNATINAPNATIVTSGTPGGHAPGGGRGGVTGGGSLGTTGAYYGTGAPVYPGGGFSSRTGGPGGPMGPGGRPAFGNALGPSALGRVGFTGPVGPSSPLGGRMAVPSGTYSSQQTSPSGNIIYNSRDYRVAASKFKNPKLAMLSTLARQASYNTFTADAEDPKGEKALSNKMNRTNKKGELTTRAKLARRTAAQRAARSGDRQSKGYKRMEKFQGSATAKMGVGLALGAMSQFAPEEAQGALALGGAVGSVNPLAGVAVAGLGTAFKSRTATGGAVSGLAGGAAAGALIGTMGGPLGMAAGAIIGGLIGSVSGAIMGTLNKKKLEVKASKKAAGEAVQSIINNSLSFTLDAVRKETGVGRSATRDAFGTAAKYSKRLSEDTAGVPLNRKNYAGIVPDVLNRGATGGQLGLAFESATGKRMPKLIRKLVGGATQNMDIIGNVTAGIVSKLGGKSLLDNRVLNPLGYGTNNKKDVDRQKQESKLSNIFRNQSKYGLTYSAEQQKDMMKKPGEALRTMRKDMEVNEAAMAPLQKNYNSRLDALAKITGKSDQENIALAKTMGVNLMDSTKDFNEVLKELGLTTVKTAQQMRAATTNLVIDNTSIFQKYTAAARAPEIIDERAESLREQASGGKLKETDINTYLEDQVKNYTAYFGEGVSSFAQLRKDYEQGGAFAKGRTLEGMEGQIDFANNPALKEYFDKTSTDLGNTLGADLNAKLLQGGKSINTAEFTKRFKNMTPEQQVALQKAQESGFALPSGAAGMRMVEASGGNATTALLKMLGLEGLVATKTPTETTDLTKLPEAIAEKTTALIDQMKIFFEETDKATPAWYATAPSWWAKHGDTKTPRGQAFGDTTSSRLSQTMGRHASMDSALTGKRTVTSGYRNYGLGSMNSDHVTGRAYDLVGQNLGQYQSLVKSTGGFAEFHGVNKARHLHVVPGSGAIGDNMMPVARSLQQPMTVGSGGKGNNFYVTGSQNASANEIAEIVMQRVRDTERSNSERR